MVKGNVKIYPLANVTKSFLNSNLAEVKLLEEHTKTQIAYNFDEGFFDINADNQSDCMKAEAIIRQRLLPLLNQQISPDYIYGVYSSENPPPVEQKNYHSNGRPFNPEIEDDDDDDVFSYEPLLEEDNQNDQERLVIATFRISPTIPNIYNFLFGPPQHNMQPLDYIEAIESSTNVKCCLEDRTIKITGELHSVEEAERKFRIIQKICIKRIKPTVATCLHYPRESGQYGLYFCNIQRYRHKKFIHVQLNPGESDQFFVLIPTFINPHTREYDPPVDLINQDTPQFYSTSHCVIAAPSAIAEPSRTHQPQNSMARHQFTNQVPSTPTSSDIYMPSAPPTPTSSTVGTDRFEPPSWGDDRTFTSSFNTGNLDYLSSERLARAFTPPHSLTSETPSLKHDFPSLQDAFSSYSKSESSCSVSTKYQPSVMPHKKQTRKVIRIVSQKSAYQNKQTASNLLDRVRMYNYNTIKNALEEGLEAVRGFRGEIRLSAKLGKVLWSNITNEMNHKVWNLQDINDIVVKELGAKPRFTNITTIDKDIINCMSSERLLQCRSFSKTSFYEFHCLARNQPAIPYTSVVLHMNEGVLDFQKAVITEKKVTEINWVSLDRKYDFQLNLTTRELIRKDVKPFTTFLKWISICPITQVMTYENVPNFLQVEYVLHKSTTRYRTGSLSLFIIEVSRYERILTKPEKGTQKIRTLPGQGEVWYDFEVIYTLCDAPFKANLDLDAGCQVKWNTEDILQTNSAESTITAFVKYLLHLIEKIEQEINYTK